MSYTYDANGRATAINDGRGNSWTQGWDAMGRRLPLVTPNPGGGAFTHCMYYNGNGNIAKTTDFKAVSHYYACAALNRVTETRTRRYIAGGMYDPYRVVFRLDAT